MVRAKAFSPLSSTPHSKFLAAYPSLISGRNSSIGEQEHLLVLSLPASEPVNTEFAHARAFQSFIKSHRAEQEQAVVGASGGGATSGHTGLLPFFPARLQFVSPDVTISYPVNGFKAINGIPGTLIVFDSGLGYVSTAEIPTSSPPDNSSSKAAISSSSSQPPPFWAFMM